MTGALTRWRDRPSGSDEEGSLLLVMLLIMFMTIVLITATTGAFGAVDLSNSSTSRNDTLQAAMAGVQAAQAEIRSANSGGLVAPTQLPCTAFSGVTNNAGTPSYSVSIQYYAENPSNSYVAVACNQGSGPQVTVAGDYLSQAVVTSCAPAGDCPASGTPAGSPIWRRVVSTYTFETTNVNISGGVINSYVGNATQECLVAAQNPLTGAVSLDVTPSCAVGNSFASMEQFQYTSTWNLAIDISNTEYCIQDPEDLASPESSSVALVACSGNTGNAVDQWGINDQGSIEGVLNDGSGNPNPWCLYNPMGAGTAAAGTEQPATLSSCPGGFSAYTSWQMSPSVGAGGALPAANGLPGVTAQMFNYQQFGLCMDVTNQDPFDGYNFGGGPGGYLIDYDCKQFPDTSAYPVWNQRWCFDKLSTTAAGNPQGLLYAPYKQTTCSPVNQPFCAVSPQTKASASSPQSNSTAWVYVTPCGGVTTGSLTATPANDELWTVWGTNGGSKNTFTWTDYWGSCMEANANDPQDAGQVGTAWSTIQVDTCSGSYAQKWDAPATYGVSQLTNTHEGTGNNWVTGP